MCQFIETIRMVDGVVMNLPYHQQRVNRTLDSLGVVNCNLNLKDIFDSQEFQIPAGIVKARMVYDRFGIHDLSLAPYEQRSIRSFKLVTCNSIEYAYKSTDRSQLNYLREERGNADEIIIVKDGLLTDTSFSNIALFNGNRWVTPQSPLLNGTMRQFLLKNETIFEKSILVDDVLSYQKLALINAMLPLGACEITIDATNLLFE